MLHATALAALILSGFSPANAGEPAQAKATKIIAMVPVPRPQDAPVETATTTSTVSVLNTADIDRYRRIFVLQEAGNWKQADSLISQLEDDLLGGHVLAQRFLHPTAYRSRFNELKEWLAAYADHPDSPRLYKLALSRRPASQRRPAAPAYAVPGTARTSYADTRKGSSSPRKGLSANDRKAGERAIARVHSFLRQGATLSAKKMLMDEDVQKLMSAPAIDWARARLATGYFTDGHDNWALDWATLAARSAKQVPESRWTAGLAAWRLNKLDVAAKHFEALAKRDDLSPGMVSGAAFWAARVHLRSSRPHEVSRWLERAADQSRTFYGFLARRLLGLPLEVRWADTDELEDLSAKVVATPAGRRALALMEVGETDRAAAEFLGLAASADSEMAQGILAIAGRSGMPTLAIKLDSIFHPDETGFDGGAYPIPAWSPEDGFRVDRALIYALILQESRFRPNARSPAGARGLMQLMPSTASWVAGDRALRSSKRNDLLKPALNLKLGQRYIEMLLAENDVNSDILRMLVAWNGGPGNLAKWLRNTKHQDDPLLFIEAITRRETRMFVEKVLSNVWIYRDRLGQSTPSLDDIASGRWPTYEPQDGIDTEVAENAPRRR